MKAKSQVVGRERFEQRFQAVCDAIGDEGENRAGEKERDENEVPLFHGRGLEGIRTQDEKENNGFRERICAAKGFSGEGSCGIVLERGARFGHALTEGLITDSDVGLEVNVTLAKWKSEFVWGEN